MTPSRTLSFRLVRACALALTLSALPVRAVAQASQAQTQAHTRYAESVQHELELLGRAPSCTPQPQARVDCSYRGRPLASGRKPIFHAVYSDETDSVYFYVERYLSLAPEAAKTAGVLRRLMELNWELLIGKLEWNPRDGEVRISAVLSTDSNFDRRAFRSIVAALEAIAQRYERELIALSAP